jgi:hypothetical protein
VKRYACMMAAAILFWGLGFAADLHASIVILNPTEDTWISRSAPYTIYGSDTVLTSASTASNLAETYALLKFDVSSLSGQTIQGAVLHLYQFGGAGIGTTALIYWADNSWAESTATWDNSSVQPEARLFQSSDEPSHRGDSLLSFSWDSSWGNIITLVLAEQSSNGVQNHDWYSKEYSDTALRPKLEITTTAVPIPAAIWLFGSGLLGLIGIRRFRK